MKKIILYSLILGAMLTTAGVVVAAGTEKAGDESSRYLIKSNNSILKMVYGVNHRFDSGFTTELSKGQLKFLNKLGVETEEVGIYTISARPYCGDGKCHPILENADECPADCGISPEPGCDDGVCEGDETVENCPEDCSLSDRSCLPEEQIPWGIDKIYEYLSNDDYIPSGGMGIVVAVLDTGVYKDHLDLENSILDCKDATKRRIKDGCADGNGHGTHVAGTILANGGSDGLGVYGVAPEAKLMAIKVLDNQGSGWSDDIAAGIYYAADNGANIISMSLGSDIQSSLIMKAVDHAVSKGVLVIAAAGNDGHTDGDNSIDYPAANQKIVAVAAFDSNDETAYFSSLGINPGYFKYRVEEREIEFIAPGVDIESIWNDGCYHIISGTSMAAPHITGIAARDWQFTYDEDMYDNPAEATRAYLQGLARTYTENVNDYGLDGDDIEAGFGLPIVE